MEEGENLIKNFMRDTNVIIFIKNEFVESDTSDCNGKIIGTNVPQGSVMSTGETLVFIVNSKSEDS